MDGHEVGRKNCWTVVLEGLNSLVQSTAGGQLWVCSVIQFWDSISNSNLSDVNKATLSILMDDTKLKEAADKMEGRAWNQILAKLTRNMNQMLKKGKRKVHLRWNNLMQQQKLGPVWLDSSSTDNILEDHGGQVEHECVDYYCSRKTSKKSKAVVFSFYLSFMSSFLEYSVWFGTLSYKVNQREFSGGPKRE